jgi:L-fuconolactonase
VLEFFESQNATSDGILADHFRHSSTVEHSSWIMRKISMSLTRRDLVRCGVAGLAGLATCSSLSPTNANETTTSSFPIVDTHTHFYDPTRPQGVPWPAKNDAVLYRSVLPKEFQTLTKPFGITGTVIVEASPWVEDNQWLLDLAEPNPFVLGIVGNLEPGSEAFAKHLARFAKNPLYSGIRINSGAIKKGLEQPGFIADIKRLIDANLELDVNGGPEALMLVDQLANQLPQLRIVINHLSNVKIDGKEPPAEWQSGLKAAARHKSVFLKVSALIENARQDGKPATTDTAYYQPILKSAWQSFGEDRLMYGSNWPVSDLAGPYSLVFQIVSEFFSDKGQTAKEKFFARNAQAAYRWPNP